MTEKTMQIQKNSKNQISEPKSRGKDIYQIDRYLIGDQKMDVLVRMEPVHEEIIAWLRKKGIYKTKSEAIRSGIIELGKQYDFFGEIMPITDQRAIRKMEKISKEIDSGKRKTYTLEEVKKKYGFK